MTVTTELPKNDVTGALGIRWVGVPLRATLEWWHEDAGVVLYHLDEDGERKRAWRWDFVVTIEQLSG